MAYTKLIVIHSRLDRCLDYTQDEEKTSLETVLDYAMNRDKTEQDCFETALNCSRETAYSPIYLCGAGRKRCYRHLLSDEGSYWQRNRQLGVHRGRCAAGRSWLLPL